MHTKRPLRIALLLLPFLLPLLMLYPVLTRDWSPNWSLTGDLLLISLCPLASLLIFQRRYRLEGSQTDHLISFTMSYGICLIYYNFEPFTHWLLLFGTGLQIANLLLLAYLTHRSRHAFAPPARNALIGVLAVFLGVWLSLTLDVFTMHWSMLLVPGMALYLHRLQLPAPSPDAGPIPPLRPGGAPLHFGDLEGRLKQLDFDSETIRRIQHKCNTPSHHLQHVAEYTRAICLSMGFSAERAEQIGFAALLHDIGKLEIPDAILFDSGKLTSEAFETLCSHNRIGSEMLLKRDSEFFRLAAHIALYHHERTDGTGYLKCSGEEIPLPARIVAVADVFDALTAPRVYKQPWEFDAAFSYITENSGILFDTAVVADFIKCKPAIRQIYDSYFTPTT